MTSAGVTVNRTLKARPEQVFAAWLDADSLREWFVPKPGFAAETSCDPVVGGRYRVLGVMPGGVEEITGEYLEIERPRKLVFTFSNGYTGDGTVVTVTFAPGEAADTTDMTIRHDRLPQTDVRKVVLEVWGGVLDKFDVYLAMH